MTPSILWLHDKALRISHPVFLHAPKQAKAIFIWDDAYFKRCDYSLKRLVFIYETLCTLPVEIIQGDTLTELKTFVPATVYIPYDYNLYVQSVLQEFSALTEVKVIPDEPFVITSNKANFKRFSKYWKKVGTSALMLNGKEDA